MLNSSKPVACTDIDNVLCCVIYHCKVIVTSIKFVDKSLRRTLTF